jgi:endoglucanase
MIRRTMLLLQATLSLLLLASCDGAAPAAPDPTVNPIPPVRPAPAPVLPALGRGVNFGNMLEATPREGDWGLRVTEEFFDRAQEAGAVTIRLPVRFSNYAAVTPPYTLSDSILSRVAWAVDQARRRDLNIVIDMHHHTQLSSSTLDRGEPVVPAANLEDRFVAMWGQIADRFRDASVDHVAFELLNEPNGDMTSARWNALLRRALAEIRRTNPTRWVVIGPVQWNSAFKLSELSLPDDPRLIVTIHNYDPFAFTHQGAEWVGGSTAWLGTTCCNGTQINELVTPLETAARWNASQPVQRALWLGEFGAYSTGLMADRARYARLMRDEAERRGMSWAYWELAAGFGFWDPNRGLYRAELRTALFGQ